MTRTNLWRALLAMALAVAALALVACGDDDDDEGGGGGGGDQAGEARQYPADTSLGRIQRRGEITIGVKYDVPPFGFRNPQTGDVEGFDVDMGRFIAEELGVEPRFVEAISDNRIPFLQRGTVDLILSTMTITEERDQEIDYSEPYYIARGRILVPQDSDIRGLEDLAGNRVCTALGSTYEETIREEAPEAELRLVDTYSECLELLQNGAIDAISTDDVILTGMIIQDDTLEMVGDELTTEPYGVGIQQGDRQMKQFVDQVLQDVKQDGRWEETYQKWVGRHIGREEQPPDMTLEEALELAPL
ncbi:MAG TPA: glutamate ABC transporter substrate-binding protein [Thermoleophilaceae bacterium]|nr:glutamate ABC transporter substrate-binding protein [Thermoleophilaceae bacterium]